MRKHQLYVKFSRCKFGRTKWHFFLGHVVSGEGIQVDPKKIKVVIDWLRPITVTKVRSSLDLAGSLAHISTERRPIIRELHGLIEQEL